MKLITRDTDYAARAICYMARQNHKITTVGQLVRELKIPGPFLRKILQVLNKKKLLKSYKGLGGGFKLAIPPSRILLTDLMKIFQGPLQLNECIFKNRLCPNRGTCELKRKIDDIEGQVYAQLKTIHIASLL